MPANLFAIILIALFFYRGYRRGVLVTAISVGGLILAYVFAYVTFKPIGLMIEHFFNVPRVGAYALGGLAAFLPLYLIFSVLSFMVNRRRKKSIKEKGEDSVNPVDKWMGGVAGAAVGAVMAVLCIWVYNMAQFSPAGEKLPDLSQSAAGKASSAVIEKGSYAMAKKLIKDENASRALSAAVSDPARTASNLKEIVSDPKFKDLASDPAFQAAVETGDPEKIMRSDALRKVLEDEDLLERGRELGLVDSEDDAEDLMRKAADGIARLGQGIEEIRQDPEVREMMNNPEILRKIETQDISGLMTDRGFHELVSRVMELTGADEAEGVE